MDFAKTPMGRRFFDSDVPRLVVALERLAVAIDRLAVVAAARRQADEDAGAAVTTGAGQSNEEA